MSASVIGGQLREQGSYTRALLESALAEAKIIPNIAFEVSTREAVAEAVRRGFGLGPVLDGEAPRDGDLALVPLAGGAIVADDYLVCQASSMNYGAVRRFLSINARTPDGLPPKT
jgi:DNA-binding transcriptional LysR family regulator